MELVKERLKRMELAKERLKRMELVKERLKRVEGKFEGGRTEGGKK